MMNLRHLNASPRLAAFVLAMAAWMLVPGPGSAQTCVTPPAGLVGWWRGESNSADAAGTNQGILQGGIGFSTGEVGQALSFNGTDADVKVPASGTLNVGLSGGITMEAWI